MAGLLHDRLGWQCAAFYAAAILAYYRFDAGGRSCRHSSGEPLVDRHPPPPTGCACHLPLAGEDLDGGHGAAAPNFNAPHARGATILPRQGEVAPKATEGEDGDGLGWRNGLANGSPPSARLREPTSQLRRAPMSLTASAPSVRLRLPPPPCGGGFGRRAGHSCPEFQRPACERGNDPPPPGGGGAEGDGGGGRRRASPGGMGSRTDRCLRSLLRADSAAATYPHLADRHPPPPSGCACHLPLAGEDWMELLIDIVSPDLAARPISPKWVGFNVTDP